MKTFTQFILEKMKEDNKMPSDIVKNINRKLLNIAQTNPKTSDINEMFRPIEEILGRFGVVMVADNFQTFKPSVIINKQETFILLADEHNLNEEGDYNVYDNIALNIKWNIFNGDYAIREAQLVEKRS